MFKNKDFYPTPRHVIEQMLIGVDILDKVVLDPSAGSGNIMEVLTEYGAKEVLACENDPDLKLIAGQKGRLIADDWMQVTASQISHIHAIIANPPFSVDTKHVLHMWDIAPGGCQIVSLINYESYDNAYSSERRILKNRIAEYGKIEFLGDVFSDADRKTGVEIGLIRLWKPKEEGDDEFEGYFDMSEEYESQGEGVMQFNEIRNIVNRYVGAVKMFDEVMAANNAINDLIKPIKAYYGITFGAVDTNKYTVDRESFKKDLQKAAWVTVFNKMNMDKYVTERTMSKLNRFVEEQGKVPFTMKNIHKMVEMIVGTHGERMNNVLIEVFDWLTEHHKGNRAGLEGWKTNSMYFVGQKFIAPHCGLEHGWSGQPSIRWSSAGQRIDELVKALCVLTGKNYDNFEPLYSFFQGVEVYNHNAQDTIEELAKEIGTTEEIAQTIHSVSRYAHNMEFSRYLELFWNIKTPIDQELIKKAKAFYDKKNLSEDHWGKTHVYKPWGQWLDWGFFEIRVYKKGTLHAKFKDEKVWEQFNIACAKAKGWRLPTNTGSDVRRKETGLVVKDYEF